MLSTSEVERCVLAAMNRVLNKVLLIGEAQHHERQQRSSTLPPNATKAPSRPTGRFKMKSLSEDSSTKSSGEKKERESCREQDREENAVEKLIESLDAEKGDQQ